MRWQDAGSGCTRSPETDWKVGTLQCIYLAQVWWESDRHATINSNSYLKKVKPMTDTYAAKLGNFADIVVSNTASFPCMVHPWQFLFVLELSLHLANDSPAAVEVWVLVLFIGHIQADD